MSTLPVIDHSSADGVTAAREADAADPIPVVAVSAA
ncbi:MAG: hypothetical protein AVDCRST_MAG52-275 [uncultured Blastococcus sp.]|uniref:Uncharacterized protein n=1 Tax=uncultured Blastococcus sp. TaxID=217144 RepID=A0A6J4HAH4_9ACTN|nr:MAG: hypothetical protein AVDCRST_MAG52-275 [uncultured Blastococcus sp.]